MRSAELERALKLERRELARAYFADVLVRLMLEREWTSADLAALADACVETTGGDRTAVEAAAFLTAVHDPRALALPSLLAIEAKLRLLCLLDSVSDVSLWVWDPTRPFQSLVKVGDGPPPRNARATARAVLFDAQAPRVERPRGLVHGIPVLRWQEPAAALVVRARPGTVAQALALARETAHALSPVLERELLLRRSTEHADLLTQAGERRLQRVALDLHDGPLQDIALLMGELRLFRQQVADVLEQHSTAKLVVGRVEDLSARLAAIDTSVRELGGSFDDPAFGNRPLAEVIESEVRLVCARAGIDVDVVCDGALDDLTPSQSIAIYRIIQEALANVREHSQATRVAVSVHRGRDAIRAAIVDDGVGFAVERAAFHAAKRGRRGLIGMSERARLLGGVLNVESRPGGPTQVVVTLPEWRPDEQGAPAARLSLVTSTVRGVGPAPAG